MDNNITNFLTQLDTLNKDETVVVVLPSTGKKTKFKPMSVKQHKDIIKTAMEGFDGNIRSNIVYNNILKENSLSDIEFKTYDRNVILLNIRKSSIGSKVDINEKTYDVNDLPPFKFDFETPQVLTHNGISATVDIPTIDEDTVITEKASQELNKISNEDKKIKESVGILLTYEIIKYIKSVTIAETTLNFEDLSLYDKKSIVEQLPLKLNNKVINFITDFKEHEQSMFTFEDGEKLVIDASFLTGE
jgi:hypothetical protein